MVKTTVKVTGMMCMMCENHVNEAIKKNFEVKSVESSHDKNETVIVSEQALDVEKVKAVIAETGYQVGEATQEEAQEKKGLFGIFKK